jgi:uncharacterized protein YndB with AHSA1/START domain
VATTVTGTGNITLRATRRFAAPRERVFDAWTTPEALKRWWCPPGWEPERIDVDLRAGGAYYFGMRALDGGSAVSIHGRFLEVRRPERLVYTWRWHGAFEGMPETRVTVEFLSIDGGTDVVLVQENFPNVALWQRHRSGWIAACDRMEQILLQWTLGSVVSN